MSKQQGTAKKYLNNQDGQTLIETLIAIFLLTTALVTGLGLAVYVLSSTSSNKQEIIATSLAREGVEVVRAMRDSNWLAGDAEGATWDLTSCADIGNRFCYPKAYQAVQGYNSYNLAVGNYRLSFSSGNWTLESNSNYNLYHQSDGTYTHTASGASNFARKVVITSNTASPFTNQNSNWELIVKSIVGWRDKNCTAMTGQDPETTNCKIIIEEHLTNWKDYK